MEKEKTLKKRTKHSSVTKICVSGSVLDTTGKEIALKQYLAESPKGTKLLMNGKVIGVL